MRLDQVDELHHPAVEDVEAACLGCLLADVDKERLGRGDEAATLHGPTSDLVDASLAVLADQLDLTILTTDPTDMKQLGAQYAVL